MTEQLFTVQITVPRERVFTMLVGAREGGCNYWCGTIELLKPIGPGVPKLEKADTLYNSMIDHGFKAIVEGKTYLVGPSSLQPALALMAQKHVHHFANMLTMDDDANTADVFFQLLVLGEVIYG